MTEMTSRRAAGIALTALPFVALAVFMVMEAGWVALLVLAALTVGLIAPIHIGSRLLSD